MHEAAVPNTPAATIQDLRSKAAVCDSRCEDEPQWVDVQHILEHDRLTEMELEHSVARCDKDLENHVVMDCDETGAYVALEIHGDMCKCIEGLQRLPNSDEHVELRIYEAHTRKAFIDRSDDLLTDAEIAEHAGQVTQAIMNELKTWEGFRCFERRPRHEAPCVISSKWVLKWKMVKGERIIRARLCLKGFMETGADPESNYSATASRFSQRLLVSECVLRGWTLAA